MSKIPSIALIPSGYKASKLYSVLPTNGDADLTFARTGEASRVDENKSIEQMATSVPRLDYTDGGCPALLLEPARKNLFLNSETGVTQSITVVSGVDYAVSFRGTGSITFSGGATGTLSGTSADDKVSQIITTTTTSVTCTVSGTVEYVNFEINTDDSSVSYATSWIKTEGTSVTRNAETLSKTGLSDYINSSEGVLYFEGSALVNGVSSKGFGLTDSSLNNVVFIQYNSTSNRVQGFLRSNAGSYDVLTVNGINQTNNNNKIALVWDSVNFSIYINGSQAATMLTTNTPLTLSKLDFSFNGSEIFYGKVKELRLYNEALTDAELTTLTTL